MKSIVILIDYFGSWPKWFPVFLASCRYNGTIDWVIRTDCEIPPTPPGNVKFIYTTYSDYVINVSQRLKINFNPAGSYKICDLRPLYGELYADDISNYDYYGYGDLDVIYGDIRKFYTDEILTFDVISTHEDILSGHFALFKNTESLRKAYLQIPRWREYLEYPTPTRFDEDVYSFIFIERNIYKNKGLIDRLPFCETRK